MKISSRILIFSIVCSTLVGGALFWRSKSQPKNTTIPTLALWTKTYPNIKTITIRTSKILLPASLKHPGLTQEAKGFIPEPIWVIGMRFETVNAPTHILHHLNLLNATKQSPLCRNGNLKNLIFAAGRERTFGFFPLGYGYAVGPSLLNYSVMLHNPDTIAYNNAETRITLWYVPIETSLKSIHPLFLSSLGACIGGGYDVPAGTMTSTTMPEDYVFQRQGEIIFMGGHLHDYGTSLAVILNGRPFHTFIPVFDHHGHLESIPLSYPTDAVVRSGDRLNIEGRYHNTSDHPIDAMSQLLMFVHLIDEEL